MILARQSGLGRGLGAIISPKPGTASTALNAARPAPALEAPLSAGDQGQRVLELPLDRLERNPHQPRTHFDHDQLEDLISSIKEYGVIQPLIVTRKPDGNYQLIAGERRLRAAAIAGLKTVPAIVREAADQEKLELAIIENVQRQDLNPIDEARAYQRLIDEFSLTQDEVSKKVGKSRPQVANMVRLLQLPEEIQRALVEGRISASNGRTLLSLPSEAEQLKLFHAMLEQNFTVRQTEARVPHRRSRIMVDPNLAAAEDQLRSKLNCKVDIKRDARGQGEVRLKFYSDEELKSILEKI